MQAEFWKTVDATINRIIWREVTSVADKHMRKGIAKFLAAYLLTAENINNLKIQGILTVLCRN